MQSAESPSLSEAYSESEVAERLRMVPEEPHYDERLRWSRPDASHYGPVAQGNRLAVKKPSIGGRMVRATVRFVVAVMIGVAGTLAWQAYGDQARTMVAAWDPSLAPWLGAPAIAQPAAAAAVSATDLAEQLKPITLEIAAVRQDLAQLGTKQDQLAANQGQMAQGLSALQAIEHELGVKVASLAAPKPVHPPVRQPTQLQPRPLAPRPAQPPDDSEPR